MTNKNKLTLIKDILIDVERKNVFLILKDLIELKRKNSFKELKYYFRSLMYKKDAGNIHMYLNDKIIFRILDYNSQQGGWYLLDHKIRFLEIMKELPGSVPLYLGKIEKGIIYNNEGDSFILSNKTDLLPILNELVKSHKVIFIKKVLSSGGKDVFRYDTTSPFALEKLNLDEDYVIEKGLDQHNELNEINPYCVNTLRVISLNLNGEIRIPSCLLRIGVNQTHNDNVSTGGLFINYDIEGNKLDQVAMKYTNKIGTSFYKHPETHYIFKDQTLPYPNKVIDLVIKSAKMFPDRFIIGWDVAYTPERPVIIEGNSRPCPIVTQISLRGLRNNKIYDEAFRQFYN